MSYKIFQFGTMVLPNYNAEQDFGLEAPSKYMALSSGGDFDMLGSEMSKTVGYKLNKACTLHAETEAGLLTAFQALRALVGKRDILYRLRYADNGLEWATARFEGIKGTRKSGDSLMLAMTLVFHVEPPRWSSQTAQDLIFHDVGAGNDDLSTCQAESDDTAILYGISQDGNVDQADITLTFTALGAVSALTVTNLTTGHAFSYNGTIAAGDTLVVDWGAASVKNDGIGDYDHFTPPTDHEEWMILQSGTNLIQVEITGGPVNIEIEFYDAWA